MLKDKTDSLVESLYEFSTDIADIAWFTNKIGNSIYDQKESLDYLTFACSTKNQVNTRHLSKLTNLTLFNSIRQEWTSIVEIRRDNQKIVLSFTAPLINDDITIFRQEAFQPFVNLSSKATQVKYSGPPFGIYNKTNNCTKGLWEVPTSTFVPASCLDSNFSDPTFQDSMIVNNTEKVRIKIIKTPDTSFIYCFFNNITIDEKTYAYPPTPFKLPSSQSFKTDEGSHSTLCVKINGQARLIANTVPFLNKPNQR